MGISSRRLLGWAPWILTFVLANGFSEELMFRGLFLKKFEPLLGAPLAHVLIGFVFAVGHAGVTYTADILVFVAITFVFALIWGYLMQKTGAVWGSALFHAGADLSKIPILRTTALSNRTNGTGARFHKAQMRFIWPPCAGRNRQGVVNESFIR